MPRFPLETCLWLAGPTASGKSELAMILAERLQGEIISVDSMQVYCGLDVGTAKPTADERRRVPHHLIDVVNLNDRFDAAQFVDLAEQAACSILARKKKPIFCGGTGFYFKALLEGIGEAPPSDLELKRSLEATPLSALLEELERKDPVLYAKIDRRNLRRVVRAVEVIRLTGRAYSEQRSPWTGKAIGISIKSNIQIFGLNRTLEDLHRRVNQRVDNMFAKGLVQETKELMDKGLALNRNAMQALGYRQVVEYLQGQRPLPDTIELVKQRTRQFARRQLTWFRRQLELEWFPIDPKEDINCLADIVMERVQA